MKKNLFLIILLLFSLVVGLLGYMFIIFLGDYVIDEKKLVMNSATTLIDHNGNELASLYLENRELISIYDVPEHVQNAFIAIEDARFYDHPGIDFKAIVRAIYKDLLSGSKAEGGSTITQQLAKNIFLTHEKTWLRKTKEVIIAINLERNYSKKELLEFYLNKIYFGHGAYGIQAAAAVYFNKDVSALTVEEGALLAALPKAPNHYSPIKNYEKAMQRRNVVLARMEEEDYLEPEETVRLQGTTINLSRKEITKDEALLAYIDLVIEEAESHYQLTNDEIAKGGYKIVVPMDKQLQKESFNYFQESKYFPGVDDHVEGAFVLLDKNTGGVLAVQGGRNYVAKGLHRAKVKRQPGSTFKPLVVYSPALESKAYHPYSLLTDKELSYNEYEPKNVNDKYANQITMYDALLKSSNAPAVWLLNEIGLDKGKEYAEKFDMPLSESDQLALGLGGITDGVSPIQMAKAYTAFANNGEMLEPYFISAIYNREGKQLKKKKASSKKVISKQTAWYMTKMLQAVVKSGTARFGSYEGELAGKTGSTQNPNKKNTVKDAWFVGYTPNFVGALWMGYDKTTDKQYLTSGSKHPTILFKKILSTKHEGDAKFKIPVGVNDLEAPVRLPKINQLKASLSFNGFAFLSVNLKWDASSDKRVHYEIYEIKNHTRKRLTTVIGESEYRVSDVPIFGDVKYYIVPVNPQTLQRGEASNEAGISFFSR